MKTFHIPTGFIGRITLLREDTVRENLQDMRRIVLNRVYTHLQTHYAPGPSETASFETRISLQDLDALLAFKSDPYLDELRAAVERLEEGTFGICLGCKQEISVALIDADPVCRLCERCERRLNHVEEIRRGFPQPA